MNWSRNQCDIYEAFEHGSDSLLIEAVAGSGKTTVLVELARIMQRAMPERRGVFLAFNKSIAMELERRIDQSIDRSGARNVQAMTLHSAGWSAWRRAGGIDWTPEVDREGKTHKIMREVMSWEESKRWGETTRRLVGYAKGAGIVPAGECLGLTTEPLYRGLVEDSPETWESLIDHYGLDPDECNIDIVRRVLARSIELARESCDFDDMLYMPVIAGVPFDRYDVVLVDEAQDVSGIQMEMISRMVGEDEYSGVCGCGESMDDHSDPFSAGHAPTEIYRLKGRVIAVGDRHQAIYGFRGAGTGSMDEMRGRFGMRELPLSVSYRCPRAVVLHARQWVPQIEWAETAMDGYVGEEGTDWQGQSDIALGAPYSLEAEDEVGACCMCTRGEHWIGIDGDDVRNCKNALVCHCPRESTVPAPWMVYAPEGISKWRGIRDFQPGDAILCRLTRPLVAAAFSLIRARIPGVHVLGRDIGKGLVDMICKAKIPADDPAIEAVEWLNDVWAPKQRERLRKKQQWSQLGILEDKLDTISVFYEGLPECYRGDPELRPTVRDLIAGIERLFVDANGGTKQMITLATVHKAKGLEWERVFVLDAGELMPVPWGRRGGWELAQEKNLSYVAATRARHELRYIKTSDLLAP